MSTMITEVYNAFKEAGVSEEKAQAAAEALNNENSKKIKKIDINIEGLKKDAYELKAEAKLTRWMIALVITIQVIPFIKALIN